MSESISKARDLLTKLRETRDPIERVEVSRSLVKAAGEVKAASLSQRSTQATGRETAQTDQVAPPQQAAGGSDGRHVSLVTGPAIVVKPRAKTEIAKIILPDTAGEKPQQGAVLAVGPGRLLDNGKRVVLDLKEGDRVLFAKYSGTEFKIEDDDLLILSERDILAVIGNDN